MIQRIIAALLVLVIMTSCEVPIDVDLPHTERLVIDGFIGLIPEESELRVLRTLPPLARYEPAKMRVPSAMASIEWKGVSYPLSLNADSVTFVLPSESTTWDDGLVHLSVKGLGKTAVATTRIPKRPVVISSRIVDTTSEFGFATTYVIVDLEVDTGTVVWSTDRYNRWTGDTRPMSTYGYKDIATSSGTSSRTRMRLVAYGIESFALPDSVTRNMY